MWKSTLAPLFAAAACTALPAVAASITYNVQTVMFPGDNFTQVLGINDQATAAGFHGAATAQGFTLKLPGSFTGQNFPNSAQTMTVGINNAGSTAGIYVDTAGFTHGYTDIAGVFKTVDAPATIFNQALGINLNNITVGYSATDKQGQVGQLAYSQQGGQFTDINRLLPANQNSQAVGINDAGDIVGFYLPTADTSIGFLDRGGVISTIDPFGSTFTQALGINRAGEIVGFYVDANGTQHGYTEIGGIFTGFDPAGSVNTTINSVNNLGQLAGFYTTADDNVVGFVATPAPEPATWSLFGVAGLALIFLRNSRLKRSKQ